MQKFNAGDKIVYDTYGICVVKEIKKMSFFPGIPLQNYYVLCVLGGPDSTYYVPCENESLCEKMRFPLTKEEIHEMLDKAALINTEWIENRQLRSEQYRRIISDGVSAELVSLIRCIYKKKSENQSVGKKLSATDESLFMSAQKLISHEFSYVLSIDTESVADYIGSYYDSCNGSAS